MCSSFDTIRYLAVSVTVGLNELIAIHRYQRQILALIEVLKIKLR